MVLKSTIKMHWRSTATRSLEPSRSAPSFAGPATGGARAKALDPAAGGELAQALEPLVVELRELVGMLRERGSSPLVRPASPESLRVPVESAASIQLDSDELLAALRELTLVLKGVGSRAGEGADGSLLVLPATRTRRGPSYRSAGATRSGSASSAITSCGAIRGCSIDTGTPGG